ncbi:hypothetical protein JCM3770_000824 [Rhodotorula araucariae]
MTTSGQYAPLSAYPPASLRTSRLFSPNLARPASRSSPLKTAAALLCAGAFALLIVYGTPRQRTERDQRLVEVGVDPDARFEDLWQIAQQGWRPFGSDTTRSKDKDALASWAERLPAACADEWVETGRLCDELEGSLAEEGVDLLWTWTNGSDPLLQRWRAEVTATLSGRVKAGVALVRERKASHHYREHDELRFSLRSALAAFDPLALVKLHLVSTDFPANKLLRDLLDGTPAENLTQVVDASRVGQVPTWFDRSAIARPPLAIHHHSSIFEDGAALPTFNSLSIESQLPNLRGVGEFFLYMNDDTFLFGKHSLGVADVGTPFLGPVFRIQSDLTVDGGSPRSFVGSTDGEWASLKHANWLLDRRFGTRSRGYLAHIPKSFSAPILREVGTVWHDELLETSTSRFRGRASEYQLPFLATHYTIEAHREALLHAFFAARSDRDLDGNLSLDERTTLLAELAFALPRNGTAPTAVQVSLPRRAGAKYLLAQLDRAGLRRPGATGVAFSAHDGHGMVRVRRDDSQRMDLIRPVAPVNATDGATARAAICAIDFDECFGAAFLASTAALPVDDVLRRVAYEAPQCGDCVILALVGRSGSTGLSAFLPSCPTSAPPQRAIAPPVLFSPEPRFASVSLAAVAPSAPRTCASARALATRRILRYAYTLGDSESQFVSMRQALPVPVMLRRPGWVEEKEMPTFLTLNDDFATPQVANRADEHLARWFKAQWPDPSPYERSEA